MADVTPLGRDRFLVIADGRSTLVHAVRRGGDVWMFAEGTTFVVGGTETAGAGHHRGDDETALSSPMPASVASIKVSAGDRVQAGDVLIVLEAMKMELPISAPRDGLVKQVRCAAGDLVQPGIPLVELE